MRKWKCKELSIVLLFGMILGLGQGAAAKAAEVKVGYGYKAGKLYSIEVRKNTVDIKDMADVSLKVGNEERYVIGVKRGEEEKYFCVDKTGKKMSEEYDLMYDFQEGMAIVGKRVEDKRYEFYDAEIEYQYGYIDTTGKLVIPMKYSVAKDFLDGIAIVNEGRYPEQRTGVIDKRGKVVIPFSYSDISTFNKYGIAIMETEKNGTFLKGLIHKSGKIIVEPNYFYIEEIPEAEIYKTLQGDLENSNYGLMNHKGELIVPNEYTNYIQYDDIKVLVLNHDKKAGMVDYKGNIVIPFDASSISEKQENGLFFVGKGEGESTRFGLVNKEGKILYPFVLSTYDNFEHGLARVSKGENFDQWGLIDTNGKEVVSCDNDYIFPFSEGMATFQDRNGGQGFYDTKGKVVLDLKKKYEEVGYFSEGLCPVKKKGNYGYIDKKGKLVIPCKFGEVDNFINGTARIYKTDQLGNRRIGLINKKGKQIAAVQFLDMEYKDSGEIKVGIKQSYLTKYGFLNKFGKMILPPKYDEVYSYHGKVGIVSITKFNGDVKFGLADKSGKLDKTIRFDDIYTPYKGMFKTVKNTKNGFKKYGMMDSQGKEVLKAIYDGIENYEGNGIDLAVISNNEKQGLINEKGKIVLPIKYHFIYIAQDGVKIGLGENYEKRKYGFTDKQGKIILKPEYEAIGSFDNNMAYVRKNGKEGYINTKGKIVIPMIYDYVGFFEKNKVAVAIKEKKYGMIDRTGKTVVPFLYESLEEVSDNLYAVRKNEKVGYINKNGKEIIPIEFDNITLR